MRSALVAVAVVGSVAAGATVAAVASTSTPTVRACASAKGLLGVVNSKGHCPPHYAGVTLDQQGPRGATGSTGKRGAQGPGVTDVALQLSSGSASKRLTIGPDDLTVFCGTGSDPLAYVEIDGAANAAGLFLHGTLDAQNPGDITINQITSGQVDYPAGESLVAVQGTAVKDVFVEARPSSSSDTAVGSTHVLVSDGTTLYSLDAALQDASGECQAYVQIVPGP